MNIVITAHNAARGGGEIHAREVVRLLQSSGFQTTVLTHGNALLFPGHVLVNGKFSEKLRAVKSANILYANAGVRDAPLLLAARLLTSAKIIVHKHTNATRLGSSRLFFRAPIYRTLLQLSGGFISLIAHELVAVSSEQTEELWRRPTAVLPPLLNFERFAGTKLTVPDPRCVEFLCIGRAVKDKLLGDAKNWLLAVEVAALTADTLKKRCRIRFVGTGELLREIEEKCSSLNVQFTAIPETDNPYTGASANAILLHLSKTESFGMTCLEAQFLSLRAVVSLAIPADAIVLKERCLRVDASAPTAALRMQIANWINETDHDAARKISDGSYIQPKEKYLSLFGTS